MTWLPEINAIKRVQEFAAQMGGTEGIAKQHIRGKLTVRERLDLLLDKGSFSEIRPFVGTYEYDGNGDMSSFLPANLIGALGTIDGRPVCVRADDFTIRGGSSDDFGIPKNTFIQNVADNRRIPLIKLLDGAGGSVREVTEAGSKPGTGPAVFNAESLSKIPIVSAIMGSCAGWIAIWGVIAHWTIMLKNNAELFTGGPPLVKAAFNLDLTKQQLGGYHVHACESGVVDNVAEDEEDLFRQIRWFLSYLPQNVWHQPPRVDMGDDPNRREEELLSSIPRDRKRQYNVRRIIKMLVDKDSLFEIGPLYGKSLITTFARFDGYPVALMVNNCLFDGGAQTPAACEKMMRFADMADTFHIPIVYLVDVPGFMLGPDAEKLGILRKAARTAIAMKQVTVPYLTIIMRRQFGVASMPTRESIPNYYAWPSGEWGSLPAAGGALAAYRKEIEAAADPDAKRAEIEERIRRMSSVQRRANSFLGTDIIDPRDTRLLICDFVKRSQEITATQLGPKFNRGIRV
ncbi:MAG: carboxyl transferase domain-containing protein [Dehalococcoidales bacterium]|nr:carboxyl transferase domain-containing protein [Dehalococcoidales bacterium]